MTLNYPVTFGKIIINGNDKIGVSRNDELVGYIDPNTLHFFATFEFDSFTWDKETLSKIVNKIKRLEKLRNNNEQVD